jgi:hypothetical protein
MGVKMPEIDELLERFRRGPDLLAVAITGAAGPEFDFVLGPEKWSIRQIMAHVSDSEIVGADRFRRIIAEENPTLVGYDQNAWAVNLDYTRRKPSQALEMFRRVRAETYELLKELPEQTFERTGNHTERGSVSLRQLLRTYAEHAENHAIQLGKIREAYRQSKAKV